VYKIPKGCSENVTGRGMGRKFVDNVDNLVHKSFLAKNQLWCMWMFYR